MGDVVRVNQTIYSWTSTAHLIDQQPYQGIVAVEYEQKRTRKRVYGARQQGTPLGFTSGKYEVPTFTMKFLKDSAETFTDYLNALGEGSYGDAMFNYLLQISEPDFADVPITVSIEGCMIEGRKSTYDEGIDELVDEFTIACLLVTENGKQLWSAVRSLNSP